MTELHHGDHGEPVAELQRRLNDAGFLCEPDTRGAFGPGTEHAVREFQKTRGLPVNGACDESTWGALVESGFRLGDRLLYVRSPMFRGDDVAELQHRLNALGFDAGREDGILGEETATALREFQRNAGVAVDGICGPATVLVLSRLGTLAGGSVALVRELEIIRTEHREVSNLRIAIVAALGLEAFAELVAHELRTAGATVLCDPSGPDPSTAAATANRFGADVSVALAWSDDAHPACRYFGNARFRSARGEAIARCVLTEISSVAGVDGVTTASATGFTRETRAPAVVCELPHQPVLLTHDAPQLAHAIALGIAAAYIPPPRA